MMTKTRFLAALPLLGLAGPALAQGMACDDHAALQQRLADSWGESRQSIGLGADGAVMEVFASEETGTWTIAVTRPGGPTCIVAAGEHFEALAEALPPAGEGA
jgi:hypothetical protein